jgi:hypothetical protein
VLCGCTHGRDGYSSFQWDKGRLAKCWWCVRGFAQPARSSAHHATHCGPDAASLGGVQTVANLQPPMPQGALRWLSRGEYAATGKACVVKWYRSLRRSYEDEGAPRARYDRGTYDVDLRVAQRAVELVARWNESAGSGVRVRINVPQVMQLAAADGRHRNCWQTQGDGPTAAAECAGQQFLVEPYLPAWERYNSNSGWSAPGAPAWAPALSHFTYACSGGECLLCDLKGCEDGGGAILSDPSVHSTGRAFGPSDLGRDGIRTFFAHHVCNALCTQWPRPPDATSHFPAKRETSVELPRGLPPSVIRPPLRTGNRHSPLGTTAAATERAILASACVTHTGPVYTVASTAEEDTP